ncbi:hypothetical protein D3C74_366730 [compost metagenome]
MIGMHEVYMSLLQACQQRALRLQEFQPVPPHMRHLIALAAFKPHRTARQNTKPLVLSMLFTFAEEQLHTEADAEQRLTVRGCLPHYRVKTCLAKVHHRIAESADAGQQYTVSAKNRIGIARYDAVKTKPLHSLAYAVQIAHAIVDNCYRHLLQHSLRRRHTRYPRIDRSCLVNSPSKSLEHRFDHMVRVLSVMDDNMQRNPCLKGELP